jgi:hypothetical protein
MKRSCVTFMENTMIVLADFIADLGIVHKNPGAAQRCFTMGADSCSQRHVTPEAMTYADMPPT